MGNVTHVVPGIHPLFSLSSNDQPLSHSYHTTEFAFLAGTQDAHARAIESATGLALTGLTCLLDESVLCEVKREFSHMELLPDE